jgi:hypothetical protein
MKLTYRGVDYEHNPLAMETIPGETSGMYRGANWQCRYPRHIPVPQPAAELKYRGVRYHTGCPLKVEVGNQHQKCGNAGKQATVTTYQKLGDELAQTHLVHIRYNLERRLQVAKEKGDKDLIQLLEDEAKQLASGLIASR